MKTTTASLAVSQIRTDGGTQPRVLTNDQTVKEYAERYKAGDAFPPIVVFFDGEYHWLGDGNHRLLAQMVELGRKSVLAEIRKGTRRDALLYAMGANTDHGLRRTNQDKRRAVEVLLTDEEWSQWSNVVIARHTGVGESFVRKVRDELAAAAPSSHGAKMGERTVRRGDSVYTMKTDQIGARAEQAVASGEMSPMGLKAFQALSPDKQLAIIRADEALDDDEEDEPPAAVPARIRPTPPDKGASAFACHRLLGEARVHAARCVPAACAHIDRAMGLVKAAVPVAGD